MGSKVVITGTLEVKEEFLNLNLRYTQVTKLRFLHDIRVSSHRDISHNSGEFETRKKLVFKRILDLKVVLIDLIL